ncbi:MAG: PDZ domain-containing protein [Planctomycetota bacterium]|nr:PDZ domain-containing protein [Planctomycetota bacterium]MDA1112863.1 PDZ domain-containing protein [Planctomycetota bacterium]
MNEKLLRFVLVLIGLGTLGGFGWKMYGFVQNKDTIVSKLSMSRLEGTFGADAASSRKGGHLFRYEKYKVLQDLNITGYVAPPPKVEQTEVKKPKPRISEDDVLVPWIQAPSAAWIQGRTERASDEHIPGDLIAVGSKFELGDKKGLKLKLVAVRPGEVELEVVEGGKKMIVKSGAFDVDQTRAFVTDSAQPSTGTNGVGAEGVIAYVPPEETLQVEPGTYAIGSSDVRELERMSQEEILNSVPVRVARDPLSNKVRGLRIRSVPEGSVFSRLGIKADDIVLEVNGQPAVDRDQLFRSMRELDTDKVVVKVERLGGVRTLTFRLPR